MVDCTGLENRRTERYRGFESLSLRKKQENKFVLLFCFISMRKFTYVIDVKQNKKNGLTCKVGSPAKSGGLSKKFSQSIEEKL